MYLFYYGILIIQNVLMLFDNIIFLHSYNSCTVDIIFK